MAQKTGTSAQIYNSGLSLSFDDPGEGLELKRVDLSSNKVVCKTTRVAGVFSPRITPLLHVPERVTALSLQWRLWLLEEITINDNYLNETQS